MPSFNLYPLDRVGAFSDAEVQGHIRHSEPLGQLEHSCPACGTTHVMLAYEWSSGPFGGALSRKVHLHLYCPLTNQSWVIEDQSREQIESHLDPVA